MPKLPRGRERRLEGDEEARLLQEAVANKKYGVWLSKAIALAVETGMRENELASLEWGQVNLDKRNIRLTALLIRSTDY